MVRLFDFVRRFSFFKNKKWRVLSTTRRNIQDVYHFDKKCDNQGSHGKVYKGEHIDSHEPVAIKFISQKVLNMLEVECLKKFSHYNIVRYIESFDAKDGIYIITEKCQGDLFDLTLEKGGRFTDESEVSILVRQILNGIQYILNKK
ncbi:MAG: protein kinase [Candidatus Magnetoovum sp. WYHC-5]|nr:protein kinase [Candidatus Magnetoovum sp. WYHC-5]